MHLIYLLPHVREDDDSDEKTRLTKEDLLSVHIESAIFVGFQLWLPLEDIEAGEMFSHRAIDLKFGNMGQIPAICSFAVSDR